jgi:type IX secretion system PorP/SprF family membrane protein
MRSGGNSLYPTAERFGQSNTNLFDVGLGASYSSNKILAGVNVAHINQPKERINPASNATLPMRYTVHFAYTIQQYAFSQRAYNITPSLIYQKQAGSQYLNVGAYWSNDLLSFGAHYRVKQALIFSAGLSFDQFSFGYSYDYFLANADTSFGNTNEFTLSYRFNIKKKKKHVYVGKCPDVFKNLK